MGFLSFFSSFWLLYVYAIIHRLTVYLWLCEPQRGLGVGLKSFYSGSAYYLIFIHGLSVS
ncbi:hypothetical protein BGX38DRAFT_1222601, partial [Terfezia claveryi]